MLVPGFALHTRNVPATPSGKGKIRKDRVTLPETNIAPENGWLMMVGRLLSSWDGLSSGVMLVSGSVVFVVGLILVS